jgi:DNA repair protein RadD
MLRWYQRKALDDLYEWWKHNDGHVSITIPTAGGKSHCIAELCKESLIGWPETRIIMLTSRKELIEQNAEKMKKHWPDAPLGIYSASVGIKEINSITFAGIQSIHKHADKVGCCDMIIVDESHEIGHKNQGMYRNFINDMIDINPKLRVVGWSASPWRLGHGRIDDGEGLFNDVIEPVDVKTLMKEGYLCKLQSKFTDHLLSTEGVGKRGGEYIDSQLQKAINTKSNNQICAEEIIRRGYERNSWAIFCTGIDHAKEIRDELRKYGVLCEMVSGKTEKSKREQILADFKSGKIRCVTNCDLLTTGWDAPNIDLLAMLRPTMSPGKYYQIIGRSLRIHPDKKDCIVLDFAGNISEHGPITDIRPPKKKGEKQGEAPVKVCEHCQEIVHLSAKVCPACGEKFPPPVKAKTRLHQDDIMGLDRKFTMRVGSWRWSKQTSSKTGDKMIRVTYYGESLSAVPVGQYFCIYHQGSAGDYARTKLYDLLTKAGVTCKDLVQDVDNLTSICNKAKPPSSIDYEKNGKFFNVKKVYYEV